MNTLTLHPPQVSQPRDPGVRDGLTCGGILFFGRTP
jgi:hypothetical protein